MRGKMTSPRPFGVFVLRSSPGQRRDMGLDVVFCLVDFSCSGDGVIHRRKQKMGNQRTKLKGLFPCFQFILFQLCVPFLRLSVLSIFIHFLFFFFGGGFFFFVY